MSEDNNDDNIDAIKNLIGSVYYNKFNQLYYPIFGDILTDSNYQSLFYYIAPHYSHINFLPYGINSWKELFKMSYKNIFPPTKDDFKTIIDNKEVFLPIEGACGSTIWTHKIHILEYDDKEVPIKFSIGKNLYARKGTDWYIYNEYKHCYIEFELNNILELPLTKKRNMFLSYDKHLVIPYNGAKFFISNSYLDDNRYYYEIIDIKWDNIYPYKMIAKYVGNNDNNRIKELIITLNKKDMIYIYSMVSSSGLVDIDNIDKYYKIWEDKN